MQVILVLPLLIPFAMGISALIRFREMRRLFAVAASFANMLVCLGILAMVGGSGMMVSQMGDHPAPFGITLAVDTLSAIMLAIAGIIAFASVVFSLTTVDINRERFAYYPLIGFLLLGINFAFLTGDLFTLYVAFEVMLMSSFVLLTLGGEKGQLAGGLQYVTLNLISSAIFLIAAGLTYAVAGTLNLAQLAERLPTMQSPGITTLLAGLFLVAFGIKAAIFPLFFWLPASYHTPPIAVTALFGGILTKVGIYAMWRVLVMTLPHDMAALQPLILVLAALTMVTGVLGAVAQTEVRKLLSFHIVSQIGYLLMGIGLLSSLSMTGAVFFVVHVILAKTALFFIAGAVYDVQGSYKLKYVGGFQKSHPFLTVLFLISALSLAGLPPFPGFWAKLMLIQAGLEAGQYLLVAVALGVSLLTLYSMTKLWHEIFWKPAPEQLPERPVRTANHRRLLLAPSVLLAAIMLLMIVFAQPMLDLSEHAAEGILQPAGYIQTVLVEATP